MSYTTDMPGTRPAIPAPFSRLDGLPKPPQDLDSRGAPVKHRPRQFVPGLAITAAAVGLAWFVNTIWPAFSPLTCAVLLGAVVANARLIPASARPGLGFAGKRLMRAGIVLLGLKLALGDVLALGWGTLAVTVSVVVVTFVGTNWLGRKMGLPGDQPLLVATGFSICGASAVAAMNSVTDSEEDDVITSVALVTLCGTLAIILLPLLHQPLGLTDLQFGRWTGASVHDVGQVVATAQTAGQAALDQAVVVKMMRIAMLAPVVATMAVVWRRRAAAPRLKPLRGVTVRGCITTPVYGPPTSGASAAAPAANPAADSDTDSRAADAASADAAPDSAESGKTKRPPLVPLFVIGFLAMVALRSTGVLSSGQVNVSQDAANLLMAAGLFALGTGVDIPKLARTGGRALALGLVSWLLIATVAYAGVRLTT